MASEVLPHQTPAPTPSPAKRASSAASGRASSTLRGRTVTPRPDKKTEATFLTIERVALATLIGIGVLCVLAALTTPFTWPLVFVIAGIGVHAILGIFVISLIFNKVIAGKAAKTSPRKAVVEPQKKAPPREESKPIKLSPQEQDDFNRVVKAKFTHFHVQPSSGDGAGHGGNLQMTATSAEIPESVENFIFDKASAPGLQQTKSVSKQPMCEHMGDADSCKDGDAGAVKNEVFNRFGYRGKRHFFFKPLDIDRPAESNNYEYINHTDACHDLRKHMIGVHGKVKITDPETKEEHYYLVMDDACKDDDGKEWATISNTKLAGRVNGINPIASLNEIKATNREKGWLDFLQMWFGSLIAPDFKVTKGKLLLLNYWKSKENFEKVLEGASLLELKKLQDDLEEMEKAMEKSGIAFIGASVIILQEVDPLTKKPKIGGALKAKLIDPAHIQVPAAGPIPGPVYTGNKGYPRRFKSNRIAMEAIIGTVEGLVKPSVSN